MNLKNKILNKLANFDILASLRDDIRSADSKVQEGLQEFLQDEQDAVEKQKNDLQNHVQPADVHIYDWYYDEVNYIGTYVRQNTPTLADNPKMGFVKGYELLRNGHNEQVVVCLFYEVTNEKTGEYNTKATGYSKLYNVASVRDALSRGIINNVDEKQYILSIKPTDNFDVFKSNIQKEINNLNEGTDRKSYENKRL